MWADNGSPFGSPRLDGDPGPTSRISHPTVPDRPPDRHPGLRRENSITLSDGMSERTSAISADRRANRVWKLRRMAVPEWDVLCRVGPGHWLGAGLPSPRRRTRGPVARTARACRRAASPPSAAPGPARPGWPSRSSASSTRASRSCRDGGLARRQPLVARSRPGRGAHGHGREHFHQRRLEPGLSLTRRLRCLLAVRSGPDHHPGRSPPAAARRRAGRLGGAERRCGQELSAPPLCRDRWLRGARPGGVRRFPAGS